MYDRMAIAPTGHPQMPNMLYLWQFFRAFPFPPLYSLLFPTLSLSLFITSPFHPAPPVPQGGERKNLATADRTRSAS